MKKMIMIGAATLLVTTGTLFAANTVCGCDCPICPQGTCCPSGDCCPAGGDCCSK